MEKCIEEEGTSLSSKSISTSTTKTEVCHENSQRWGGAPKPAWGCEQGSKVTSKLSLKKEEEGEEEEAEGEG